MDVTGVSGGTNPLLAGMMQTASKKTEKQEKSKGVKKGFFESAIKREVEKQNLINEGLPPEIAEMDIEEASIFLCDKADIAADELRENLTEENLAKYRKALSQVIKYISRNNYEVLIKKRNKNSIRDYNKNGKLKDPRVTISIINENLDQMYKAMLNRQKDSMQILKRIDEIKGLIVDLIG